MSDQKAPTRHPFAQRPADIEADNRRRPSELERFLGGSPLSVAIRLLFLSLLVGFFLVWLDIRPIDVLRGLEQMVRRFWNMGFQALREMGAYIAAGAAIVVPLWLVLRLLNVRPRN
jgi:Domain of unknown function (DUF6460)